MTRAPRLAAIAAPLCGALGGPAAARAAGPEAPLVPATLWRAWSFEPGVVIPLALAILLYARGVRAGGRRRAPAGAVACFLGGCLALAIALVSPLDRLGGALFWAHMVQHEILMLVAAPLLVLGRPLPAWLRALPGRLGARLASGARGVAPLGRALARPWTAWGLHALALWVWHAPRLFEAALESETVHALQHASFLGSALLFWWALLQGRDRAPGYGAAVLVLFTTALHTGLLGALITFAGAPLYPAYLGTTAAWGLSPMDDQQLGGIIMWVPACSVELLVALALFAAWLRAAGEAARRAERARLEGGARGGRS